MSSAGRRAPVEGSTNSNVRSDGGRLTSKSNSLPSDSHACVGTLATRRPSSPKAHSAVGRLGAGGCRLTCAAPDANTANKTTRHKARATIADTPFGLDIEGGPRGTGRVRLTQLSVTGVAFGNIREAATDDAMTPAIIPSDRLMGNLPPNRSLSHTIFRPTKMSTTASPYFSMWNLSIAPASMK